MPRDSIEKPISAVRMPQTMKRRPTKSTWEDTTSSARRSNGRSDGDAHFHAHRLGMRRTDAEAERRAVGHARRNCNADVVPKQRIACSMAAVAALGPDFATAA